MTQVKIHVAIYTVCDYKTSWLLYSTRMDACAYNRDNLYNTGWIYPPGMVRIVYIVLYIHTEENKVLQQ